MTFQETFSKCTLNSLPHCRLLHFILYVSISFQELHLTLRPFEILALNDNVVWLWWMEPGGTLTTINVLLVSICCAHTMLLYDPRITNGLSLTVLDFILSGISWSLKDVLVDFFLWLGNFGLISKYVYQQKMYFSFSFRMWIEIYRHCALHCAYQRFIFAMMSCTEYLHTAAGAIKSPTFSVLYCT